MQGQRSLHSWLEPSRVVQLCTYTSPPSSPHLPLHTTRIKPRGPWKVKGRWKAKWLPAWFVFLLFQWPKSPFCMHNKIRNACIISNIIQKSAFTKTDTCSFVREMFIQQHVSYCGCSWHQERICTEFYFETPFMSLHMAVRRWTRPLHEKKRGSTWQQWQIKYFHVILRKWFKTAHNDNRF